MTLKSIVKANGIHYTPAELAAFLADRVAEYLPAQPRSPWILDPACGTGALLEAMLQRLPRGARERSSVVGFETDSVALQAARAALSNGSTPPGGSAGHLELVHADFLETGARVEEDLQHKNGDGNNRDRPAKNEPRRFDVVVANPPYVRSQALGAQRSQELARRFELSGRVDLYQAFVKAMWSVMKPGAVLGLLTSNKFLTTASGAATRRLLRQEFDLLEILDLGDTKLFAAAVLPVIVIARRKSPSQSSEQDARFTRVYQSRSANAPALGRGKRVSLLATLRSTTVAGEITAAEGTYSLQQGVLAPGAPDDMWTLATPESQAWLAALAAGRASVFAD
ncbi:MAG: N-6 DNA methylase, partial [Planctomycetales bacterium]